MAEIRLLGSNERLRWKEEADALAIEPVAKCPCEQAGAYKVTRKAP